jgi:hypothetical protein
VRDENVDYDYDYFGAVRLRPVMEVAGIGFSTAPRLAVGEHARSRRACVSVRSRSSDSSSSAGPRSRSVRG